jgi:hypothetical protein
MTAVCDLALIASPAAVTVVFDVSFVLLAIIGASIIVPVVGAMFLGVWCRMYNVPTPRFVRRWLAYLAGYFASLLISSLMMFLVKDAGRVPGWFLASLFGQAIAVHALVVPWVLKTAWGKQITAQAMTLMIYGAVLVIAMAPIIIHVRRAVDRGEWTAELENLHRVVTGGKGLNAEIMPETLADVRASDPTLGLLPGHEWEDTVYLGDYINDTYPSMLPDAFASSMARIREKNPGISPLLWRNPDTTGDYRIAVISYDGTVAFLTRRELFAYLDHTLPQLNKAVAEVPITDPGND